VKSTLGHLRLLLLGCLVVSCVNAADKVELNNFINALKLPLEPGGIPYQVTCGSACSDFHQNADYYALDFTVRGQCLQSSNEHPGFQREIRATHKGVVTKVETSNRTSGYGVNVEIRHVGVIAYDMSNTEFYLVSKYAHLDSVDVNVGDQVRQGQLLGRMGNTGNFSSSSPCNHPGTHLHFVMYWDKYVNGVHQTRTKFNPVVLLPYNYGDLKVDGGGTTYTYYSDNYDIGNPADIDLMLTCGEMAPICQDSDNDGVADDTGGSVSQGPSPTPVSGSQPDLTPDFDVFHQDGHEISSNCNNCPTENVSPGQVVAMRLETETHNRNVQTSDLRDANSQSIDGEIWCQVEGYTDWQEILGSEDELEYDVDNLVKEDGSSVETILYTVPNYPGAILACRATVDGDNEVMEEDEGNNDSRMERFLITATQSLPSPPQPDLLAHDFSAGSVYQGDPATFVYRIKNQGQADAPETFTALEIFVDNSWIAVAPSNRVRPDHVTVGYDHFEEVKTDPINLSPGAYSVRIRADGDNRVDESDEDNNVLESTLTVVPRPKPKLVITKFQDRKGCCTTNRGEYLYPNIWIRNDGAAAPAGNVRVLYQVHSPVGTGGAYQTIGYGTIEPRELQSGDTDEDYMDGSRWKIPKSSAWKKQWHTVRACVNQEGGEPTCGPADSVATYARYSKK
jgi:hypothetical protein